MAIDTLIFGNDDDNRLPLWQRTVLYDTESGTIYISAFLIGSDERVFMCAAYDGVPCVQRKRHIYFPTNWLAREYPDIRETCSIIEQRIKRDLPNHEDAT